MVTIHFGRVCPSVDKLFCPLVSPSACPSVRHAVEISANLQKSTQQMLSNPICRNEPFKERAAESQFLTPFWENGAGQLLRISDSNDLGYAVLKRNQAVQLDGLTSLIDDHARKRLRTFAGLTDWSAEGLRRMVRWLLKIEYYATIYGYAASS